MTKELTDDVKWLRKKAGTVLLEGESNELARIADRLEQLAAELSHVDAVLARRAALDDCATRIDKILKCIATAAQVNALTAERDRLREALDNFIAWADDNSFYERLTLDEAIQELRTALGKEE